MTIKGTQKTTHFWEFGAKAKIPYCAKCKSFEGVTCKKEDDGFYRTYECPNCGIIECYAHKSKI